MPSPYTENSEKWKTLASIDYLTQFVKAWICFNAWYKNYYPDLKNDRETIDEIKTNNNNFRRKLITLLNTEDNAGFTFRSYIAELHLELERKYLFNKGERITFENVVIEKNPKEQNDFARNGCRYQAFRNISGRNKKEVDIFVLRKDGSYKFSYTQYSGFNMVDLISHPDFKKMSQPQQSNLKACYEEINPSKPITLLSSDDQDCIDMGNLYFINDPEKLCKGIIEVLYKLRNVLFHGEVIPDSETNQVYKPAYQILYTLIQFL